MGKLTPEVFNPSCCDGGAAAANQMSARLCGCDPGENWICLVCQAKLNRTSPAADVPVVAPSERKDEDDSEG